MEIGYWKIKGLAEYPKWVASYCGASFTEIDQDPSTWPTDKLNLGLSCPNLPYLYDGDFKMTETRAIAVYIAQKAGREDLLGEGIQGQAIVRQFQGVLTDIMVVFFTSIFGEEDIKVRAEKTAKKPRIIEKLQQLSDVLGDSDFLANNKLSIVDFYASMLFLNISSIFETAGVESPVKKHPNLIELTRRVRALPGVKERVQSERYQSLTWVFSHYFGLDLPTTDEFQVLSNFQVVQILKDTSITTINPPFQQLIGVVKDTNNYLEQLFDISTNF